MIHCKVDKIGYRMRMKPNTAVLYSVMMCAMLLVQGCATTKTEENRPPTRVETVIQERKIVIDTACDWVRPIYIHAIDVLTPGTARQVLAHNETWEAKCQKSAQTK